jgi:hypothetical protein
VLVLTTGILGSSLESMDSTRQQQSTRRSSLPSTRQAAQDPSSGPSVLTLHPVDSRRTARETVNGRIVRPLPVDSTPADDPPADVPGWSQPQHREFDAREESIVLAIRKASFIMNRERVPPFPIPLAPSRVWFVSSDCIAWVGSAWASHYEVIVRDSASAEERVKGERDNVKEGSMRVGLDLGWVAGRAFTVVVRAIGVDGGVSEASEVAR